MRAGLCSVVELTLALPRAAVAVEGRTLLLSPPAPLRRGGTSVRVATSSPVLFPFALPNPPVGVAVAASALMSLPAS